ncbi:hypothetical protein XPA_000385 [Xanthoria parietina]
MVFTVNGNTYFERRLLFDWCLRVKWQQALTHSDKRNYSIGVYGQMQQALTLLTRSINECLVEGRYTSRGIHHPRNTGGDPAQKTSTNESSQTFAGGITHNQDLSFFSSITYIAVIKRHP